MPQLCVLAALVELIWKLIYNTSIYYITNFHKGGHYEKKGKIL